jgi:UDP-glucose:(glucosyl)LPS beta-1,3-glucosyltransferase
MENKKELVSILTPCYNGSIYIHRLLDSILEQTYTEIEMFVINDGSIDNTEEIVISYIPKFEEKGFTLKCINQSNQGQGSAINNGLKLIKGKYLVWPDSDDFYASPLSIEKMVYTFGKNVNYGMVRTFANILDETTLNTIGELGGEKFKQNRKTDLFEDCLFIKNNFWFVPGDYMLKTEYLFENYPDKSIYASTKFGGQNWQLMLPMFYNRDCYTIEEYLYNVVSRKDSHSRGTFKSIENQIKKYSEHRNIIVETLKRIQTMPNEEKQEYQRLIYVKYEKQLINLLSIINKKGALKRLNILRKEYGVRLSFKEFLVFCYHFILSK